MERLIKNLSYLSIVYCIRSARGHPVVDDIPPAGTGSVAALRRNESSGWSPAPTRLAPLSAGQN